ncbi:MAG TPA: DinB family protein [Thermoanaerobaculia bacterium]
MNRREFETLLLTLESTPAILARAAAVLSPDQARVRPAAGGFSFVENVWHLADLEREGYGVRIRRLLQEEEPALLNFDGDRIARERGYQERDVERGLALFQRARTQNLEILRTLSAADWKRSGAQEGVGRVTMADIPRMMVEHDLGHGQEIAGLIASIQGNAPSEGEGTHPSSAVA